MMKDQTNKVPTTDQRDIKELKRGLGNALGGSLNNPLGEVVGETGDNLTKPLTGR